jgi:hypothetical protein
MNTLAAVIGATLGLGAGYLIFKSGSGCGCATTPPAMNGLGRVACQCRYYKQAGTNVEYSVCSGDC